MIWGLAVSLQTQNAAPAVVIIGSLETGCAAATPKSPDSARAEVLWRSRRQGAPGSQDGDRAAESRGADVPSGRQGGRQNVRFTCLEFLRF